MSNRNSSTDVRRTDDEGVATITFARDAKLNAISPDMLDMLRAAVRDVGERDELRVLVITAEGRYFSAGIDVGSMSSDQRGNDDGVAPGIALRREYRRLHQLLDEIEALEKPIVLAAQGPCLGLGVEMAVSCDFRLAAAGATFALPEIKNLAVLPGSGGVSRLTRLVGPHWARWLAMACRTIDADQALAIGLVHEVLPADGFADAVHEFARSLVALSGEALGLAKIAIDAAASVDRGTARDIERLANTVLVMSDDHRERVDAFARRAATSSRPSS